MRVAARGAAAGGFLVLLAAAAPQRESDAYTVYELLAPATHKFRITYDVTAATPGATRYFNPIRAGSTASDEAVFDRATGKPLAFREVDGAVARAGGVEKAADTDRFIEVTLARPVPGDDGHGAGGGRVRIVKTYEDARSYHADGTEIVFDRSLGVKRNAVVLPPGYELIACNVPSQVMTEADRRVRIAFWNDSAAAAPLLLRARPARGMPGAAAVTGGERAAQTRNIVYDLQAPETHRFSLTHDYTAGPGEDHYVNIVRAGSTASDPQGRDLDTGATLPVATVRGLAIKALEPMAEVTADSEALVFRFAAVPAGGSRRIRIAETYADPARYRVEDGRLVWHRSFGRPANAMLLPAGWRLASVSVPATVRMEAGRLRLDLVNPRNDEIDVKVTAYRADETSQPNQ